MSFTFGDPAVCYCMLAAAFAPTVRALTATCPAHSPTPQAFRSAIGHVRSSFRSRSHREHGGPSVDVAHTVVRPYALWTVLHLVFALSTTAALSSLPLAACLSLTADPPLQNSDLRTDCYLKLRLSLLLLGVSVSVSLSLFSRITVDPV